MLNRSFFRSYDSFHSKSRGWGLEKLLSIGNNRNLSYKVEIWMNYSTNRNEVSPKLPYEFTKTDAKRRHKQKGLTAMSRKPLILLVAGRGFEPLTFGIRVWIFQIISI